MKSNNSVSLGNVALRSLRGLSVTVAAILAFVVRMAAAAEPLVQFDIPPQPLASALDIFSATTGNVVVYNGNLTVGLLSKGLQGRLTPVQALAAMLRDTGLTGEYTAPDAFVVVPSHQPSTSYSASQIALAALSRQSADERSFSGLLQAEITRALCSESRTRPGGYRAVVSFWIGVEGEMIRPRLLGSTGDDQRDAAIASLLGRVSVSEPPPAKMRQPFTMILLPQTAGGPLSCPPSSGRG